MMAFFDFLSSQDTLFVLLILLLVLMLSSFILVMFSKTTEGTISKLLGLSEKNKILTFLGLGMGGILIALQALIASGQTKAMEDAVLKTEQGQRQERLKNAIEHLGHASDSVRLGGAYELFHLAQDTEDEDLRQTILDILCAHIRWTTGETEYREKHKAKPSEEIQSLLTLLFVQKHDAFGGLHVNLEESWLNGADLNKASLEKAVLTGAYIKESRMQGADLHDAQMQGADLHDARMQGADLHDARMQGADLHNARMQGADLRDAQMQGADLRDAQMQGARLSGTQMQGARLSGTQMQGVTSNLNNGEGTGDTIGEVSDLSGIIFEGGLSQEELDSIVEDLPDKQSTELRRRLKPHVDQPASNALPKNSGAITGAYTEEETEQWFDEYE